MGRGSIDVRILRVAQHLYPETPGGGSYHVHALSRDQAAAGHDVTVYTVTDGDRAVDRRDGYTVHRFPVTFSALGNEISVPLARRLLRVEGFDVVHAHSHLYFTTNVAAARRTVRGPPLAITNHGLYSQTAPRSLFEVYLRTAGRATFDRADLVFVYTSTDERRVRALGVDAPIAVVPNGIDVGRFTPDGPTADRVPTDGFVVLFVGRLVEGKRPRDAIDAVAAVRDAGLDARLVIAGDGPLRSDLVETVRSRGLGGAVRFLGHVDYGAMPALYRAADVLLLPSATEGMPRTVLEALASGTPVVTSALPQLEEATTRGGIAVRVGDVEGFAAALRTLATDVDRRRRLGAEGRALVVERHAWSDTVAATTAQLRTLLD